MNWKTFIQQEKQKDYFKSLERNIAQRREINPVYPPQADLFTAFDYCEYENTKVVIIGQDPYHQPGQAMGMSFSVHKEIPLPKSLVNIFKELESDIGIQNTHGDLSLWAKQGVLLLNTILTVDEGEPMSHANFGWETFTQSVMESLNNHPRNLVFILWGKKAQAYKTMFDSRHHFIESSHPSPLGAYRGFWGSKPFSKVNTILEEQGQCPINWSNDNHDEL